MQEELNQKIQHKETEGQKTPLLAVKCTVYNHEPYLRDCLNGFVMQKTTFPFICIVHDDASTDNSVEIIKEYAEKYPELIKPIYEEENQYSKKDGSLKRILNNAIPASIKYIAICEGDDYWTDPNKLQMQADFMEANLEYGMCYTKSQIFYQKTQTFAKTSFGESYESAKDLIIRGNSIPTATIVMRTQLHKDYLRDIKPSEKNWKMGDYPLSIWFSYKSKIYCFDKVTSVYRVLEKSASHFDNLDQFVEFQKNADEIKNFFIEKFNLGIETNFNPDRILFEYGIKNLDRKLILCYNKQAISKKEHLLVLFSKSIVLFSCYKQYKKIKTTKLI